MDDSVSAAVPVLLTATVCAVLATPMVWLKDKLPGETCATGLVAMPVPDSATAKGEPEPLLVRVRLPLRAPAAVGESGGSQ